MRHKDYECWLESVYSGTQVQEKPVPLVRRLSDTSRHGRAALSLTSGTKYVLKWRRLPSWSHLTPDKNDQLATCAWVTLSLNGDILGEGLVSDLSHKDNYATIDRVASSPEVMGRPLIFESTSSGDVPPPILMRSGRLTLTLHRSREVLRRALKGRAQSDVSHLVPGSRSPVHGAPPPSVPPTIFNWYFEVNSSEGHERQPSSGSGNTLRHSLSATLAKISSFSLRSVGSNSTLKGSGTPRATDYKKDPEPDFTASPKTPKDTNAFIHDSEAHERERGASESTVVPQRARRPSANLGIENGRLLVMSLDREPALGRNVDHTRSHDTPMAASPWGPSAKKAAAKREILRRSISSPLQPPASMPRPSPTTLQTTPMVPSQPLRPLANIDLRDNSDPLSFSTPTNPSTGTTIATTSASSGQRSSGQRLSSHIGVRSPGDQSTTSAASVQRAQTMSPSGLSSPISVAFSPRSSVAQRSVHYSSTVNEPSTTDPRRSHVTTVEESQARTRQQLGYAPGKNPLLVAAEVATTARKNSLSGGRASQEADLAAARRDSNEHRASLQEHYRRRAESMSSSTRSLDLSRKMSMPNMISTRLRRPSLGSSTPASPASPPPQRSRAESQPAPPPLPLSMLLRPAVKRTSSSRGHEDESSATTRTRGGTVVQKPHWGQQASSGVYQVSPPPSAPMSPPTHSAQVSGTYSSPRGSIHSSTLSDGTIDQALRQVYEELAGRGKQLSDINSTLSSPARSAGPLPPPASSGNRRLSWIVDGDGRRRSVSSTTTETIDAPFGGAGAGLRQSRSVVSPTSADTDDEQSRADLSPDDEQQEHLAPASAMPAGNGTTTPNFTRMLDLLTPVTEAMEEFPGADRGSVRGSMSLRGSMAHLGSPGSTAEAWQPQQQAPGQGLGLTDSAASTTPPQPPERESSLARMRKKATSLKERSIVSVEELEERLKLEKEMASIEATPQGSPAAARSSLLRPAGTLHDHNVRAFSQDTFGAPETPVPPASPIVDRRRPATTSTIGTHHSPSPSMATNATNATNATSSTALLGLLAELHKLKEREMQLLELLSGREDEAHDELQAELKRQEERVKRLSGDVKATLHARQSARSLQQRKQAAEAAAVAAGEGKDVLPEAAKAPEDSSSGSEGQETLDDEGGSDDASRAETIPEASPALADLGSHDVPASRGQATAINDNNPPSRPTTSGSTTDSPMQPRPRPSLVQQRADDLSLDLVKQMRHRRGVAGGSVSSNTSGPGEGMGSFSSLASSMRMQRSGSGGGPSGPASPTVATYMQRNGSGSGGGGPSSPTVARPPSSSGGDGEQSSTPVNASRSAERSQATTPQPQPQPARLPSSSSATSSTASSRSEALAQLTAVATAAPLASPAATASSRASSYVKTPTSKLSSSQTSVPKTDSPQLDPAGARFRQNSDVSSSAATGRSGSDAATSLGPNSPASDPAPAQQLLGPSSPSTSRPPAPASATRPAISALVGHLRPTKDNRASSTTSSKWSQPSWSAPIAQHEEQEKEVGRVGDTAASDGRMLSPIRSSGEVEAEKEEEEQRRKKGMSKVAPSTSTSGKAAAAPAAEEQAPTASTDSMTTSRPKRESIFEDDELSSEGEDGDGGGDEDEEGVVRVASRQEKPKGFVAMNAAQEGVQQQQQRSSGGQKQQRRSVAASSVEPRTSWV